jgi:hypothetical protein
MILEKVSDYDFNKDVVMKSSGDDLPDIEWNSFETSGGVTGVNSESSVVFEETTLSCETV